MVRACWLIVVAVAAFAGANEVELVEAEPEKVKPPKNETPAELPICKGGCSGLSCAYPRMCKQMVAQHRAGVSKPLGDSRRGRAKRRPSRRLSRRARSRRSTATARRSSAGRRRRESRAAAGTNASAPNARAATAGPRLPRTSPSARSTSRGASSAPRRGDSPARRGLRLFHTGKAAPFGGGRTGARGGCNLVQLFMLRLDMKTAAFSSTM